MYQLMTLPESFEGETPLFYEGAVLAANFATQPLDPKTWLSGLNALELEPTITEQIHKQYAALKSSAYDASNLTMDEEGFADFSEGFMSVWPVVEEQWHEANPSDGTLRMLQALLTTFMLGIDEAQTHEQMKAAGIEQPTRLEDLLPQLDIMISEVAMAADEMMIGSKSQNVNPYKDIGRNDQCPCESGKKFKQCCGK
ncbi:YecA family protein [Vibrio nigripulchritudo]|uniref:YecA family protein n=1 Tax=Vibrio nigripulchritudo TaxID=28173 RepID=UPI0005F9C7DD|nr:SEC-C metal-binding domain-containing protein [Vibrio nigripulchritudo]KJY81224.1 prepilin peptidase [Vibrio nigripulchritudo]